MKKTFTKTINTFLISTARLLLLVCLFAYTGNAYATIRFVKATGTGDGSNWDNASGDFQAMINASSSGDEVWVAGGTYKLASGQSFSMKEGVKIYGGFVGTEESPSLRDLTITANTTILIGNGSAVVNNNSLTSASLLDGFTITGGGSQGNFGGGMSNSSSSPTLTNCSFTNNKAYYGAGMYNYNYSSPNIINCSFTNNEVIMGGGICNYDNSSPNIINCSFANNEADLCGGGDVKHLLLIAQHNKLLFYK